MRTEVEILFVAGDPGGAAALLPVITAWQGSKAVLAYRQAVKIFAQAGLDVIALDEIMPGTRGAAGWIEALRPGLIFAATSVNGTDWERHFIVAARNSCLPSLSLLDYWSNYTARFTLESALDALPDCIAIMDKRAREEMLLEGFPQERLVVTGQPVLDLASQWRSRLHAEDRARFRSALGIRPGDYVNLYVSQPLRDMRLATGMPDHGEHDEFSALQALIETIRSEPAGRALLLVKLHPRDPLDKFDALINALPFPARVVDPALPRWEVCLAADHVFGVSSMLLEEAAVIGCRVTRLQNTGERSRADDAAVFTEDRRGELPLATELVIRLIVSKLNAEH